MNLRLYIIFITTILLILVVPAIAADNSTAKVYGGVYNSDTFEPLDNAVVEINSTPSQSMVAKSGIYSFELDPGNYSITAKYFQNSTLTYSATETVTIRKGGSYRLDLLLLPVYSEELMESPIVNFSSENSTSSSGNPGTMVTINRTKTSNSTNVPAQIQNYSSILSYLLITLTFVLVLTVGYRFSKKHKDIKKNESPIERTGHLRDHSTRACNTSELIMETHKTIDPKEGQGFNVSIEAAASVKEQQEPERTPMVEPVIELEHNYSIEKPAIDLETKTSSAMQVVELESKISEKQTLAEDKEQSKEEYIEQSKEEYKGKSEEDKKGKYPVKETEIVEPGLDEKNNSSKNTEDNSEIEISSTKEKLPLPADLQEIMDIIRGHGGRITQKDLRSRLKYSEGKVSLMLADLERRDLIEKFKRGRGNVVILKDEEF